MRIVLDGVFFQYYLTGIARVWWSLLSEWKRDGFAEQILVLDRAGTMPRINGVRMRRIPPHDYNNLVADRDLLQRVCDEESADLFISTYFSFPQRTRSAVMVYDMIPEVFNYGLTHPMWQEKDAALRRASAWIAISENTRRDLLRFFPDIPKNAVTVAPCGVWPVFSPASPDRIDNFRRAHNIDKPYFLIVGHRAAEKNAIASFRAFSQFPNAKDFLLICAGGGTQLEPELQAVVPAQSLRMLGRLSDEDLATAYSSAAAMLYPSTYEGFGMPIIEAMACKCPVITSSLASIPEVAGDAVLYVNPNNPVELASAMTRIVQPDIRQRLIHLGLDRAKHFSWSAMAAKVREALLSAFVPSPRPL